MKKILLVISLVSFTLYADILPKNVLGTSCLKGYHKYDKYKNHKAFVYAREKKTDKERCNWSYGYSTIQEAIASAKKGCQSVILNAECRVIDKDGVYNVPNDIFTPLVPVDDTPLSDEEKKKLTKEAENLILGTCFPFFTKKYLKASGHKSFAYSIDSNGNYACGYSYNQTTEKNSKRSAIKSCQKNKLTRGKSTPKSPCKVYATNYETLLKAKDFGIKIEKKEDISLSDEDYNKKLEQAKKIMNKNGSCLMRMKFYLSGKMQQAYYFVKSKGEEACGIEQDAFTIKIAKEEAKKSCNKLAKKKNIKTECKLFAQNFEIVAKASDYVVEMSKEEYEILLHKGKLNEVKKYIAKGYDVNIETKKDGITPLFLAAAKGDKPFFLELLKKGANLKHQSKDGSTLLHAAVLGRNLELVEYVLDKSLDINAKGFGGNTPLHVAISVLNIEIVKLLIKKGAKTDIKNNRGKMASELLGGLKLNLDELAPEKNKKSSQKSSEMNTDMQKPQPIAKALAMTVAVMNKTLPKMTDDETRLDKVTSEGKKMTFNYTLVQFDNLSMTKQKLRKLIYNDTKSQVCADKETQGLLKKGVVIAYNYQGENHKPIDTFMFDAKVCGVTTNKDRLRNMLKNLGKK